MSNIFGEIILVENLLAAWREFLSGKKKRRDVQAFAVHLEDHLFDMHRELAQGVWRHGEYMRFTVCDPKPRIIHKASVRDRIFHHAIVRVIERSFDRSFIYDSWSCRRGKGTYHAVHRCHQELERLNRNTKGDLWVLKCDIRKYFQSIDHDILFEVLTKTIEDQQTLVVLKNIIESFSTGVPLGNLTSQLFANIYLNEFDHFVKEQLRSPFYLRYSDDFLLAHPSREWLEGQIFIMREYLFSKRKLVLHPNKIVLRPFHHGIDWLGYALSPGYRVMRTKTRRRLWRNVKDRTEEYLRKERDWESLSSTIASYDGILKTGWNGADRRFLDMLRRCL